MLPAVPSDGRPPWEPRTPGSSADYEVSIPADPQEAPPGPGRDGAETRRPSEASGRCTRASVRPHQGPCENPGDIFNTPRGGAGGAMEVDLTCGDTRVRAQPAPWSHGVWALPASEFPASPVMVDAYCDGSLEATTEMTYYNVDRVRGAAGLGCSACRAELDLLDSTLTALFRRELPAYRFPPGPAHCLQEDAGSWAPPSLLHWAARFGLRSFSLHLLGCPGAGPASELRDASGCSPAAIASRHGHEELGAFLEAFSTREASSGIEQDGDYVEDFAVLPMTAPAPQTPAQPQSGPEGARNAGRPTTGRDSCRPAQHLAPPPPPHGENPKEPEEDSLYVFIPSELQDHGQVPDSRPPLPPPRLGASAAQGQHPTLAPGTVQATPQDPGPRQEAALGELRLGAGPDGPPEPESEEDPYSFAEVEDRDYDLVLAHEDRPPGGSFLLHRPPAPTPRPPAAPPRGDAAPYIAQVFQHKVALRPSVWDSPPCPRRPERPEARGCAGGQEALIELQQRVKSGRLTVEQALQQFSRWQQGKAQLEAVQQERLRQLRDSIFGKRAEDECVFDKLTIVHHAGGSQAPGQRAKSSLPGNEKLPARPPVEREHGFCVRKAR